MAISCIFLLSFVLNFQVSTSYSCIWRLVNHVAFLLISLWWLELLNFPLYHYKYSLWAVIWHPWQLFATVTHFLLKIDLPCLVPLCCFWWLVAYVTISQCCWLSCISICVVCHFLYNFPMSAFAANSWCWRLVTHLLVLPVSYLGFSFTLPVFWMPKFQRFLTCCVLLLLLEYIGVLCLAMILGLSTVGVHTYPVRAEGVTRMSTVAMRYFWNL